MVDCYVGEIRIWAGIRCPYQWHFCDGSLLKISEYQALFALIGTTYGGDGATTFKLPDLRGRLPISAGQRTGGVANYVAGQSGGVNTTTLTAAQMPGHSHALIASTGAATAIGPGGNVFADPGNDYNMYVPYGDTTPMQTLASGSISNSGGGQGHENRMPTKAVNFIISLFGLYPTNNN